MLRVRVYQVLGIAAIVLEVAVEVGGLAGDLDHAEDVINLQIMGTMQNKVTTHQRGGGEVAATVGTQL